MSESDEKGSRRERFKNWRQRVVVEAVAEAEDFSVRESIKNWREWYMYVVVQSIAMSVALLTVITFPVLVWPIIIGAFFAILVEVYLFEVKGVWKAKHINNGVG